MYTEEPKSSINWGEIIKKGIIILVIALIVFFVIWLLTRNNQKVNVNYDNDKNNSDVTETLPNNAYSKAFIEGYRYFHDTSKEYFLISELPTTGHTLKYTLQELINKGLIIPWEYKDGKTCDTEASYAYVTNNNGKYKLTVNLVCGAEVAKTTEDLGCNQLCNDGTCNPDEYIIEYKYRQEYTDYETVYSCPAGYTKEGTKCIKDNSTTINATKKETYSCPSGYKPIGSGANMKCQGTSETIDATKNTTYTCPAGYIPSGTGKNTKCYKTDSKYVNALYTTTTKCPDGYTPNGNSCVKTTTIDATYTENKSCPNGYSLDGNSCVKTTTVAPSTSVSYNCPSGYSKSGTGAATKCSKPVTIDATPTTYYKCSEGELINTNKCRVTIKEHYIETPANVSSPTYKGCKWVGNYEDECSDSNGKCTTLVNKYLCPASTVTKDATAYTKYTCPSGYTPTGTNGTKCTGTETINATPSTNYNCPAGYDKSGNGSNTKCSKTTTTNVTIKSNYNCPSRYTPTGNKCSKQETETLTVIKNYYCENSSHILSGDKCYYNSSSEVKAIETYDYTCPDGYNENGDKCTTNGEVKNAVLNTTYNCPNGYTKVGYGSQTKCTKGATTSINATKSTKKVTKYRYKWSSETSLEGWEKTKETRTTKVNNK